MKKFVMEIDTRMRGGVRWYVQNVQTISSRNVLCELYPHLPMGGKDTRFGECRQKIAREESM